MAGKYFSKQDPTDFSIQSEDGGGLMFSKDGKYIFGAKQENIIKQLNEEGYDGNVDINPNTNSSFIAIMNENSIPVEVDIPNINQYSIFEPQQDNILQPPPAPLVDDCANEFDDVASALLKTAALYFDDFNIPDNNINQLVVTNISKIDPKKYQKAKQLLLNYFWNENKSKRFKDYSIPSTLDPTIVSQNPDKFIIKNLPPGLRDLFILYIFKFDNPYSLFPLVFGKDGIDLKDGNGDSLGIPFELSNYNFTDPSFLKKNPQFKDKTLIADKDGNLTNEEIYRSSATNVPPGAKQNLDSKKSAEIYVKNFDKYIEYYNANETNKKQVLEIFKIVLNRDIVDLHNIDKKELSKKQYNDGNYEDSFKLSLDILNKTYDVALKYINCPPDNQIVPTTTATTTPSTPPPPSPSAIETLTPEEIEEGITIRNFLPARETIDSPPTTTIITVEDPDFPNPNTDPSDSNFALNLTNSPVFYSMKIFGQADPKWGSYSDGARTMKQAGCAYTSMSMLSTWITNDGKYNPKWFIDNGCLSINTDWYKMSGKIGQGGKYKGINITNTEKSKTAGITQINTLLSKGPVLFGWDNGIVSGTYKNYFTSRTTHFLVIAGRNNDGTYIINDPGRGRVKDKDGTNPAAVQAGLIYIGYYIK